MTITALPVAAIVDAARALQRADRFSDAATLLHAADQTGHPALAVALADATVSAGYLGGTLDAAEVLAAAEQAVRGTEDAGLDWDVRFVRLRATYIGEIFGAGTSLGSVDGRDPARIAGLRGTATGLRDAAPDLRRRGWAEFYLGVIADNVYGERAAGPAHLAAALDAAERSGDDLLGFEALRHLGDHAHEDGDAAGAREQWERSTAYAARAGAISKTLAQQILLAQLARERGDEAGALLLAGEIARWAGAIGADRTRRHAEAFLDGADPTR